MTTILALGAQVLLTVPLAGEPVRFGVPLPPSAIAAGLDLRGEGALQWRRLPIAPPGVGALRSDGIWVEIAIVGGRGTARIAAGGAPESAAGRGPAFERDDEVRQLAHGTARRVRWRWSDGSVDESERTAITAPVELDGERYQPGEFARSRLAGEDRAVAACALPRRVWSAAGLLPPAGRLGAEVRRRLAAVRRTLPELPGRRGAGDFARSGGVVTNLEFDTALGLLRLALACGDEAAFAQAARCAHHLVDRDLDARTGLPFAHGPDHRSSAPAPGHSWLQGVLAVGLVTADDDLIAAARGIARGLAAAPPLGEGRAECARDFAWPLLELEAFLAFECDLAVARAADDLAVSIDRRFDGALRTFRFGEGELGSGVYLERAWITGGIVLPALRRHLQRRRDARIAEHVRLAEQELLDCIGGARPGIPTHWRCAGGRTFAEHRAERDPRALLLLEGLRPADLRRVLGREEIAAAVAETPAAGDPDLATSFSMVARCTWVWR